MVLQRTFISCIAIALVLTRVSEAVRTSAIALPDGQTYNIGPVEQLPPDRVVHLWVDPTYGDDSRRGSSEDQALKTFKKAWSKVPRRVTLRKAYHIHVKPGAFSEAQVPSYWEKKRGTYQFPIIIEAVSGPGTVTFPYISVFDCRYIYFIGIDIKWGGNEDGDHPFHAEKVTGLLLRTVSVEGTNPKAIREVVKINQCQGVYIEECDFWGSTDNAIDMVAVQYGHVINSKLHDVDMGIYLKGGSAYFIVSGNEVYNCGYLAIAAGFDTGFEWMTRPWIRYEAYDIKVFNNVIHDIEGAGLSVFGGYDILMAYNTLYKVGMLDHLIEVRPGTRTCDGGGTEPLCLSNFQAGGWGPPDDEPWTESKLPNRNVIIANNLVVNPEGWEAGEQHFQVDGPTDSLCQGCQDLPSTIDSDKGLYIRGNLIWNNGPDISLGLDPGWDSGCLEGNPTCTPSKVLADNAINTVKPELLNPTEGDFRLKPGSLAGFDKLWAMKKFGRWKPGPANTVPRGNRKNIVKTDRDGRSRSLEDAPGAYAG